MDVEYYYYYLVTPLFWGTLVLLMGFAYLGARILRAKRERAFYLYWLISWLVLTAMAFIPESDREYWAVGEGDYAVAAIAALYGTLLPAMAITIAWHRSVSETVLLTLGIVFAIVAVGTMPYLQGILYFFVKKNALLF
jgi:membrane-associated HD superfamily phosphohydrolase